MKRTLCLLFICFFASWGFAQQNNEGAKKEDKKGPRLIQTLTLDSLNLKIPRTDTIVQEQVRVEAPDYPGLDVSVESPASSLTSYKPYTRRELQAYSDLLLDYSLTDFDRSETARPHKRYRLYRVSVPDVPE